MQEEQACDIKVIEKVRKRSLLTPVPACFTENTFPGISVLTENWCNFLNTLKLIVQMISRRNLLRHQHQKETYDVLKELWRVDTPYFLEIPV